jgi:phage/conjugal plasmid C-4 type zinc finger TraR family protein
MDMADHAAEAEQLFREDALRRTLYKRSPSDNWEALSEMWCTEPRCGDRIPDDRRRAIPGVRFCVECQARREQAR